MDRSDRSCIPALSLTASVRARARHIENHGETVKKSETSILPAYRADRAGPARNLLVGGDLPDAETGPRYRVTRRQWRDQQSARRSP